MENPLKVINTKIERRFGLAGEQRFVHLNMLTTGFGQSQNRFQSQNLFLSQSLNQSQFQSLSLNQSWSLCRIR